MALDSETWFIKQLELDASGLGDRSDRERVVHESIALFGSSVFALRVVGPVAVCVRGCVHFRLRPPPLIAGRCPVQSVTPIDVIFQADALLC